MPIQVEFVPNGYQQVDPAETVTVLQSLAVVRDADGGVFEQVDANVCAHQPAAVLRPVGTKAVGAALLLARVLVPEPMRSGWSTALRMSASRTPRARLAHRGLAMRHRVSS